MLAGAIFRLDRDMPKTESASPPPPVISKTEPASLPPPAISNSTLALAVYVLYFLAYFTGITAVAGVIMAHLLVETDDPMLKSHYRFQIRTFWIGLLYVFVGVILLTMGLGVLILMWWLIWSLVRNIKGFLALNENKPVANPESLLFG
jgi:uncharacterized membrane protein